MILKLPEANLFGVFSSSLPLCLWFNPFRDFSWEGLFFVLSCSGEEGLASQLATYWLFQSPDPTVCLECITLLCRVTTCQVSGWDKTGVRTMFQGTIGEHTHTPTQTRNLLKPGHPSTGKAYWMLQLGTSVTWAEEFNFSHWWIFNQSRSAFAFPAHLCLTADARGHESQPFILPGPSPLCSEVGIKWVNLL